MEANDRVLRRLPQGRRVTRTTGPVRPAPAAGAFRLRGLTTVVLRDDLFEYPEADRAATVTAPATASVTRRGATALVEDTTPSYLSSRAVSHCARRGCRLAGTDMWSGAELVVNYWTRGEEPTNEDVTSAGIAGNLKRRQLGPVVRRAVVRGPVRLHVRGLHRAGLSRRHGSPAVRQEPSGAAFHLTAAAGAPARPAAGVRQEYGPGPPK